MLVIMTTEGGIQVKKILQQSDNRLGKIHDLCQGAEKSSSNEYFINSFVMLSYFVYTS